MSELIHALIMLDKALEKIGGTENPIDEIHVDPKTFDAIMRIGIVSREKIIWSNRHEQKVAGVRFAGRKFMIGKPDCMPNGGKFVY